MGYYDNLTAEKIEKSFSRMRVWTNIYRAFLILTTIWYVISAVQGLTHALLYVVLNGLYWTMSIWWMNTAKNTRETRYLILARKLRMKDSIYG